MPCNLLDPLIVDELSSLDDHDLTELLTLYFREALAQCEAIAGGVARGDREVVAAVAHKLRGGSLALGAARVAGVAGQIEAAAGCDDLPAACERLPMLHDAIHRTRIAYGSRPPAAGKAPSADPSR